MGREICREEKAFFCGADGGGFEAGRRGRGGGGGVPTSGDYRADLLSLEEAVCGFGYRSGRATETAARGKRQTEEASGRAEPGQDDVAGCTAKKL